MALLFKKSLYTLVQLNTCIYDLEEANVTMFVAGTKLGGPFLYPRAAIQGKPVCQSRVQGFHQPQGWCWTQGHEQTEATHSLDLLSSDCR